MASVRKNIIIAVLLVLFLIPASLTVAVQMPIVQTYLCKAIAEAVSTPDRGSLKIGHIVFAPFHSVIVRDISLSEPLGDTILHVDKLLVNIAPHTLLTDNIRVNRLVLEDGCFNMRNITPDSTNLQIFLASFPPSEKSDTTSVLWFEGIRAGRIKIKDFDFSMSNSFADTVPLEGKYQINWTNLDLEHINLSLSDVELADALTGDLRKLSFRESNGFDLRELSTKFYIGKAGDDIPRLSEIRLDDLLIDDGLSLVRADRFSMGLDSTDDFSSFVERVYLKSIFNKTVFNFNTLRSFAPSFDDNTLVLGISGLVCGTVSSLGSRSLEVSTPGGDTSLGIEFSLDGLPDIRQSDFNLKIRNFRSNSACIGEIASSFSKELSPQTISRYAPGEGVALALDADGSYGKFLVKCLVGTSSSGVFDMNFVCCGGDDDFTLSGTLGANSVSLGKLLSSDKFGNVTLGASLEASFGKHTSVRVPVLDILHFEFNDYSYHDISLRGEYVDGAASANVVSTDPNLKFNLEGSYAKDSGDDSFALKLNLDNAGLDTLGFYGKSPLKVSLNCVSEVVLRNDKRFTGYAALKDISCTVPKESYRIGDINIESTVGENLSNEIMMTSSLADVRYVGTGTLGQFISNVRNLFINRELPNLAFKDVVYEVAPEDFSLSADVRNLKPVLALFKPGLLVDKGTKASLRMESDIFDLVLTSPLLSLGGNYCKDFKAVFDNRKNFIDGTIASEKFGNGTSEFTSTLIGLKADDNDVSFNVSTVGGVSGENSLCLGGSVFFPESDDGKLSLVANLDPSQLRINNKLWPISPASFVYAPDSMSVTGFRLGDDSQYVSLDGKLNASSKDTLRLRMHDFDLSFANYFLNLPVRIDGLFNGGAEAFAIYGAQKGLTADIRGEDIAFDGIPFGSLDVKSAWNEDRNRLDVYVDNVLNGRKYMDVEGYISTEDNKLDLTASFDSLGFAAVGPFVKSLATDFGGSLSGKVKLSGDMDKLDISSRGLSLNQLKLKLDYTKVPYLIEGPFSLDNKGINLGNLTIKDKYMHLATVSGGIRYDRFRNPELNTRIHLDEVLGLNTTAADNSTFYGRAFASGDVLIAGPLDALLLRLRIKTEHDSHIHIPLNSASSENSSLLTFVRYDTEDMQSQIDSIKAGGGSSASGGGGNLAVYANIEATPEAEIDIEINEALGDVLKVRGNGNVDITIDKGPFGIRGAYNISQGSYKFVLLGLLAKDFTLSEGGTITFGGDIMKSDIKTKAIYRTKASVGTLISDSTSMTNRRTVNCGIGISGSLQDLKLGFSVDVPDLDPITKARVENALNTEEKCLKQTVSLLLSGSFLPDQESGVVNSSSFVYSNLSEIMSSQLNSIFRQLDIPLDLGFNYQPGTSGNNMFDVAISTQLFNNRVVINGNIGSKQYSSSSSKDVVGDVDVEVKLNKSGQLRLNVFSHSADQYSNYLDYAQRNGAGIVYQEEFDTFGELFRKIFWGRRRYEEYRQKHYLEQIRQMAPRDSVSLKPAL